MKSSVVALLAGIGLLAGPALADDLTIYMMTMPPHVVDARKGEGMMVEIVLEAMKRAGFGAQIRVEPNPRAMAEVQAGEDLYIISLARVPEREGKYTWVAPIVPIYRSFFTLGQKIKSLDEAKSKFKLIAVSRATANYNILVAAGFAKEQIQEVNAGETAPRMLLAGHVDAWFNLIPESKAILKEMGENTIVMGDRLASTDLYLGCSMKCDPKNNARLVKALDAMKADGTVHRLIAKYGGEG